MMSLRETEISDKENGLGLEQVLVITCNHRLELRSAHALRTGIEASILYLPDLITLIRRPAWTPGQQSLQNREVHSLLPCP
jgi:hypothetical protein